MIKFNENTLDAEMVIGDTGTFTITPQINNQPFLKEGDEVWFTMRKIKEKNIVLQKKVTAFEKGTATIPIPPEDTEPLNAGNYIYDLKLIRGDGNVDTLIPNRPYAYFALKEGVK